MQQIWGSLSQSHDIVELRFHLALPQRHFRELLEMVRISSSHIFVALGGILQNRIDGASKNKNFQKKVYQKIFICRGDILLSRAKKSDISLKIRKHINGKPMIGLLTSPDWKIWKICVLVARFGWFALSEIPNRLRKWTQLAILILLDTLFVF